MKFDFPAPLCKVFAIFRIRFSIFTRATLAAQQSISTVFPDNPAKAPDVFVAEHEQALCGAKEPQKKPCVAPAV